MRTLLAILLATAAAYLLNRRLVNRFGNPSLITVIPVIEELLKTGSSLLFSVSLWWVHLGFGALEALLDIVQRPRPLPVVGYLAAGCSFIGHGAFAAVTIWGWSATGRAVYGLLLGCGVHLLWNVWVTCLAERRWEGRS